jgi:hypothetical protein
MGGESERLEFVCAAAVSVCASLYWVRRTLAGGTQAHPLVVGIAPGLAIGNASLMQTHIPAACVSPSYPRRACRLPHPAVHFKA